MPDFRILDTADEHPKMRIAGPAAVGLWAMAGARAMRDLTDGWVSEHYVAGWPNGKRHAATLVKVGLWSREERRGVPGYQFHDWGQVQRTAAQIETERARSRDRKAASRGPSRSRAPSAVTADVTAGHNRDITWDNPVPTNGTPAGRPLAVTAESRKPPYPQHPEGVSGEGSSGWQRAGVATIPPEQPNEQGEEHERQPCGRRHSSADPCGGCGQARRSQTDQDRADEQRRRAAQAVVDACGMCDRDGFLHEVGSARPVSPYTKCDHHTDHRQQVADARDEAS